MISNKNGNEEGLYEESNCPICGASERIQLYQRVRRTGTLLGDVTVSVAQCVACGYIFNSPRIRNDVLEEHYSFSLLASGQTYRDEGAGAYYPQINADRAIYFSNVLSSRTQGRLLDIGCGVGGFLDALKDTGLERWDMCGLEPSRNAAIAARQKGYMVENAFLGHDLLAPHSFDAISMVSVLEHLPQPRHALERVRTLLKPDGVVFIEVPSILHPELSLTGNFSMEHINHFSPGSLAALFRELGWNDMTNDPLIEDHGLRLIGSCDLSAWGKANTVSYVDDPLYSRKVVQAYAVAEQNLIEMIIRRVGRTLQQWKAQGKKIAIYGAGTHTLELLSVIDLHAYCSVIFDTDTKKQGTSFINLPVHAPDEIKRLGIDAVLISSQRFQDEIKTRVRSVAGEYIEIAVCYDAPNQTYIILPKA